MVDIVLSCQVNIQHIRDALHGLQCIRTILNYFSKVHMSNVDKFMSNSKIYFFLCLLFEPREILPHS